MLLPGEGLEGFEFSKVSAVHWWWRTCRHECALPCKGVHLELRPLPVPPSQCTRLRPSALQATTYEASDYLPSASIGTQTPPSTFDAALRGIITMRLSGVELTQEQIGGARSCFDLWTEASTSKRPQRRGTGCCGQAWEGHMHAGMAPQA